MKVSFSRTLIVGSLLTILAVSSASGCRTGTGWGWPSAGSSNNWLSWNNWGWGKDKESTALASTKPPTSVPKPSAGATPQATTSIAAGTGGAAAANPTYTASNAPAYPLTNQPTNSYGAQPASAVQPSGAANQVQPSVGYQTGPYNVTGNPGAAGGSTYGQAAYGQAGQPNGGNSWNPEPTNTGSYGAAAGPYGGSPASNPGSMYGTQETSPYSSDPAQQGGYSANPAGGYGQQPAYGTGGNAGGSAPAQQTNPWTDYRGSTSPAAGNSYETQPAANYETTGGLAAGGQSPAASNPAPSSYPGVPAVLATDANSYRPGSTASGGVQNANFNQPQGGSTYSVGGSASGGTLYR